jgi:hypothetical protein
MRNHRGLLSPSEDVVTKGWKNVGGGRENECGAGEMFVYRVEIEHMRLSRQSSLVWDFVPYETHLARQQACKQFTRKELICASPNQEQ